MYVFHGRPPDPRWAQRLPRLGGGGQRWATRGGWLLSLGGIGLLLVTTIGGGAVAHALWSWLSIPGGLVGFGVGMAINEAPPLVLGALNALFYFGLTMVFTDGFDRPDPAASWLYAAVVATVFLSAAFWEWISAKR